MNSDTIIGIVVLVSGLVMFVMLGAAEAGVIAGVRARVKSEPEESRVDALRRFYQERQLTLSTLALARNLASVAVTGAAVFLVLRETTDTWLPLAATIVVTAVGFVLLQGFTRALVARNPESWGRILGPLVWFVRFVFRIPVLMLDAPMGAVINAWHRGENGAGGGPEELILLSEMEEASAALQEDEREMIRGVMDLEFTMVREVMVPRTDIVAADVASGFDKLAQAIVDSGVSRVPVYEEDIDHILGIAHSKEVMRHLIIGRHPDVREIIHAAYVVPETKRVHELLSEMKQRQLSIAIVVDEYGGVAGLVTLEDLIEEIVGEIRDEYDREESEVEKVNDFEAILDARVSIDELNDMFDMNVQKDDFDSVGGFIVNELGRMPSVGDTVRVNGVSLKVLSVAGRRIKKVRVQKHHEDENPEPKT